MFVSFFDSLLQAISKIADCKKSAIENQSDTEIINTKKDLEEATKDALKALKIADKYKEFMTVKDRFMFKHFYSEFLKEK